MQARQTWRRVEDRRGRRTRSAGSAARLRRSRPRTAALTRAWSGVTGSPSRCGCEPGRVDVVTGAPSEEDDVVEERAGAAVGGDARPRRPRPALVAQVPCSCCTRADDPLEELHGAAAVAERHQAAVGRDRERAAGADAGRRSRSRAALARPAEPERLELADDLEGERVVELGDVDVGRARARPWRRPARAARRPTQPLGRASVAVARRGRSSAGAGTTGPMWSTPPPRTYTGGGRRSAARSAVVSSSAAPPSAVIAQSRRWNGIGDHPRRRGCRARVNGPRPK